ncbi:MAG TPA: hypothetical protein VJM84_00775 [Actinomycetota bacterium]|nr:hypothetical protein [Actinomycetota bacterium]
MVPSAYLRVLQPLDGFEREEQLHWERWLVTGRGGQARRRYADRVTGKGIGVLAPAGSETADVRVLDGRTYLAPHRMRLRVLQTLAEFRDEQPLELWDSFVPKKEARRARRQLGKLRRRDPLAVPFIHQSAWHVPLRWFVLFRPEERTIADDEAGRLRLRYRTPARRAMRRAENAIPILRRSDLGQLGELLVDLHQWIASFDARSIIELDYGELSDLMSWDEMDDDHSAEQIQRALDALAKHEAAESAEAYQSVLVRWTEFRSREMFN